LVSSVGDELLRYGGNSFGLLSLKIPKLTAALAFNGDFKSLPVAESPFGETAERVLWTVSPIRRPGWTILFISTKSRKLTLKHLLLKLLLEDLNKNEKHVLTHLLIDLPDEDYQIVEFILLARNKDTFLDLRWKICEILSEHKFLEIEDPLRELRSYEPELTIQRVWTDRTQIAPKRYIGVGYNDHGTLSSSPSWKEQQTEDGEKPSRLGVLLFSIRSLLDSNLYRNSSFRGSFRLKSSKQSETGKTRKR